MGIKHFPSFGRQTRWKKSICIRGIQGFCVSAKAETSYFTVSQALFSSKIVAKCWKTTFFHSGNVAVVRIAGSPEAPPKAQKAHFHAILSHLGHFQALWRLKNEPQEPSGNRSKRAQHEPQEAPGPTMSPKRPKKTPQKDSKRVSKMSPKRHKNVQK